MQTCKRKGPSYCQDAHTKLQEGGAIFIGMINYFSRFSARLSELALPIRELAKDKDEFNWGQEDQAAFKLVKNGNNYHTNTGIL